MNEYHLIASHDHFAWQSSKRGAVLTQVGKTRVFKITYDAGNASGCNIATRLDQQSDGRVINLVYSPSDSNSISVSNSTPFKYIIEGTRCEHMSMFKYRMSYFVKDMLIKEFMTESNEPLNLFRIFRPIAYHKELEANQLSPNISIFPSKIELWDPVARIDLAYAHFWMLCSSPTSVVDNFDNLTLIYAVHSIEGIYDKNTNEIDLKRMQYSLSSIVSLLTQEIADLSVLSKKMKRSSNQVSIDMVIAEPSLRISLFGLQRLSQAMLSLAAYKDGAREKMMQRSRKVKRRETYEIWLQLKRVMVIVGDPENDYLKMDVSHMQKVVLELGDDFLYMKNASKISMFLWMILSKCKDINKRYTEIIHSILKPEDNIKVYTLNKHISSKFKGIMNDT